MSEGHWRAMALLLVLGAVVILAVAQLTRLDAQRACEDQGGSYVQVDRKFHCYDPVTFERLD